MRRIIVTGAAGFIGSQLIRALNARGHDDIIAVDDLTDGDKFRNLATCHISDYMDRDEFRAELRRWNLRNDVSAVFHQGACADTTESDGRFMMDANYTCSKEILHWCLERRVALVYASSASVYGLNRRCVEEPACEAPLNVYAYSKLQFDNYARRVLPEARSTVVGLRYFNVYGPGERLKGKMASMAWQLGTRLLSGEKPRLFVDGSQARDQVHVDDVVECTLTAAGLGQRPDPAPGVYNAGSGVPTSFNEMLSILRRALEVPESVLPTEYFEMPDSVREFYQHWTCADMSATARGLGFVPKIPPADGLRRYAEFMRHSRAKRG